MELTNFAKELAAKMAIDLETQKQEITRLQEENAELRRVLDHLREEYPFMRDD